MVTGTCFRYRFDIDFSLNKKKKKLDRYHKYVYNFILINLQFDNEYEWFAFDQKFIYLHFIRDINRWYIFLKRQLLGS